MFMLKYICMIYEDHLYISCNILLDSQIIVNIFTTSYFTQGDYQGTGRISLNMF